MKTTLILNKKRIQTLAELKENFNQAELITYTRNGRLAKWLSEIGEFEKGEKIAHFNSFTLYDTLEKLFHIFDLDSLFSQYVQAVESEQENVAQGKTEILPSIIDKAESGDLFRTQLLAKFSTNSSEIIKWNTKLAQLGDPLSMWRIGNYYLHGKVLPKNLKEAVFWLEKAFQSNMGNAICDLNTAYEEFKIPKQNRLPVEDFARKICNEIRLMDDLVWATSGSSLTIFFSFAAFWHTGYGFSRNLDLAYACIDFFLNLIPELGKADILSDEKKIIMNLVTKAEKMRKDIMQEMQKKE